MKNTKTLAATLILTTIVGGTAATIVNAQSSSPTKWISAWESQEKADSPKEIAEEKEETTKLAPLAKISESQAKSIAQKAYTGNGQLTESQLEDENGAIVYGVEFTEADGSEVDIKVDAKTGKILKVEQGREHDNADHGHREEGEKDEEDDQK